MHLAMLGYWLSSYHVVQLTMTIDHWNSFHKSTKRTGCYLIIIIMTTYFLNMDGQFVTTNSTMFFQGYARDVIDESD